MAKYFSIFILFACFSVSAQVELHNAQLVNAQLAQTNSSGGGGGFPSGAIFDVKFNGNPNDSGPGSFTGTAVGSPLYTTGQDSVSSHAILLNGLTQFVSNNVGTTFNFDTSTSFTASAWAKYSVTQSGFPQIFANEDAGGNTGFVIVCNADSVSCQFFQGPNFVASDSATSMSDGIWHLYVMVVDRGAQLMHFYVDNVEIGTAKDVTAVGNMTSTGFIHQGDRFAGIDFPFSGILDENAVWNVALSPMERANLLSTGAR